LTLLYSRRMSNAHLAALEQLLANVRDRLEHLVGETQEESLQLQHLFVKAFFCALLWDDAGDIRKHSGRPQDLLDALKQKFVQDSKQDFRPVLQHYQAHTDGSLTSQLQALIQDYQSQLQAYAEVFPDLAPGLIRVMQFSFAFNIPSVALADVSALEKPAIVAFAFGTGNKIGPALQNDRLVGPGCERPGPMNVGLAAAVANILQHRSMPVFAQWEIADALLYGDQGCPADKAAGYYNYEPDMYPLHEQWRGHEIFKSCPTWPKACKEFGMQLAEMGHRGEMQKHYLSTDGVARCFGALWEANPELLPRSVIVVAAPDHMARCVAIVRDRMRIEEVVCCPAECYPKWETCGCLPVTGFDPKSTQSWTTSRHRFVEKEIYNRFSMALAFLKHSMHYDSARMGFTPPARM